jgi:hypothetical protein
VHRVSAATVANSSGVVTLPLFPWTRTTFLNNDKIEIERPRIRGTLQWDGSGQGAYGRRGFNFTITERR